MSIAADLSARPAFALLASTLRPERRRIVVLVVVLLGGTLVPLVGPVLIGRVVDGALAGRPLDDLTLLAGLYLLIAVAGELLSLAMIWESVHVAWRAGNRLRERLADHALSLDLAWHARHTPGELISRIDGDVEALTTFFSNVVVRVLGNVVLVAGVIVVVTVIDWRLGIVIAGSAAGAMVVMVKLRSIAVPAYDAAR
nr:ABC transporter transmembrane domain-containing protein [Actinomycetota bacterium]